MTYSIEIELPRSGAWFRYFTNVDTLEEAESIKKAAEGTVEARIYKNAWNKPEMGYRIKLVYLF